jgi:lysophospholipase L1-like esterase
MQAVARKPGARKARRTEQPVGLSLPKKVGFSLIIFCVLLLLVELVLRTAGVTFYPVAITLTQEAGQEIAKVELLADGQVQWMVKPNTLQGTPLAVNSHGMRGREVPVDKPPGTIRILCLGDSCTFGARSEKPYPALLEELCSERFGDGIEVLNGAVPGHAAHQGLAMLERYLKFSPDIVTLYFGWNDHWRSTSALAGPQLARPPATDGVVLLRGLRLAYRHWRARAAVLKEEEVVEMTDTKLRLPPMHYRAMLDEFAVLGERHGFDVAYLTAPSAFTFENLRWIVEPKERRWAARPEDVIELHDHYNDISREMAAQWDVTLVDLADIFENRPEEALLHWDGIHLSQRGHALAAQSLFTAIEPIIERRQSATPPE